MPVPDAILPCVGKVMGKNGGTLAAPKGMFSTCVPSNEPDVPLTGTLDTDSNCDVMTESNGIGVCVKYGGAISLSALTVTGTRALVIATQGTITIAGLVDVQNHGTADAGCQNTSGTSDAAGGSGGAGGGFATSGGNGGAARMQSGGFGGGPQNPPQMLRFGCAGREGGSDGADLGGVGGPSGGTIYLIANEIDVAPTGGIDASGEGGGGGVSATSTGGGGGGGGGGSGGLIGFDALTIKTKTTMTGAFSANGGGGGGGNNNLAAMGAGSRTSTTSTSSPAGGMGGTTSGNGGAGGAGLVDGTVGAGTAANTAHGAGGGGGGGTGWFVLYHRGSVATFTNASPAPVTGS